MASAHVRTTIALPEELLSAVDQVVREGKARSRNDLVATAIRHELAARRRAEIDADLAGMATDVEYQAEVETIMREFARADWEAFRLGERAYDEDSDATR
jgi:metal-responsive CopG/Arc/MetJ family transcriptional regulator